MERHEGLTVGVAGLARLGGDIALRLAAHGHTVVGYDPVPASADPLIQAGGRHVDSLAKLVGALPAPRVVWAQMPPDAVDDLLATLRHLLEEGDVLIDASDSHYGDTLRRAEPLAELGVHLVDIGVSGGSWSRTQGYALLAGGSEAAVQQIRPLLDALAEEGERGWAHVGGHGAGHYARMIQEGVQYGVAQAVAEGVALLDCKRELNIDAARVLEVWSHASPLRSRLLQLTAHGLTANPQLEALTPYLEDSAEARWAAAEAIEMECPAPVITAALQNRFRSRVTNSSSDRALALMRRMVAGLGAREP
jgi:6-phosphogluconate dehydrogenase